MSTCEKTLLGPALLLVVSVVGCGRTHEAQDAVRPPAPASPSATSRPAAATSGATTPLVEQGTAAVAVTPVPAVDLEASAGQPAESSVVVAGGCFWCVEAVFEELDGVVSAVSGYSGGSAAEATYEAVCSGETGHAEVVEITYDPAKISYGQLLQVFFATHDPTTLNRQGPDWGTQYRSAIFYRDEQQRQIAAAYIQQLDEASAFADPIVTGLEELETLYPAEAYHQDFVRHNPAHGYVRAHALPKVAKVRKLFGELLRSEGEAPK